jgi:hypothetical protein
VADAEAPGRVLLDAAEALGHALPRRRQRCVARAVESGVKTDACRRAMVDGDRDGDLPCATVKAAVMSVPHIVSMASGMIMPS